MPRYVIFSIALIGLVSAAFAQTSPTRDCYAKVGPLLEKSGGKLTPEIRKAYLDWAESSVVQQLHAANQAIPEDCLTEVRQSATLRDAMFASVYPPDPSILQNYAQLREKLGAKFMASYRSLVIGVAVAKRTKGVEILPAKEIGKDYQPDFWYDETFHRAGSDSEKLLVHRIADFMEARQVAALDIYNDPTLQHQLAEYLTQNSVATDYLGQIKKSIQLGEWLKNAMVLLGQRPAAREPKPLTVDWLKHLASINETVPTSTPTADGKPMPWPLFPLKEAPWPLLMPLAHTVQLSEANYIWETFQGDHGDDRYHTYGPYRDDDDAMPDQLKPSKWFWDAWPDRIVHGGECVPISKGTVDLYSSLGKPAMWAGQPGHANLISFQYVDGAWMAEVEQAFAGGPDVTFAQWYFDEEPGTELRHRDLYYWAGAEYQLGVALAMNVGLTSYMDTRIAANIYRTLPNSQKRTLGVELLTNALQANPFNPEIWYRLAEQTPDAQGGITLIQAAMKSDPGRLVDQPRNPALEKFCGEVHAAPVTEATNEYWRTMEEFATQYSILSHPAPQREEDVQRVYAFLKTVPGISPSDLISYTDKLTRNCSADEKTKAVQADGYLAAQGDSFGQLRMGERYWNGDGVPQDKAKAKDLIGKAAIQGDPGAAEELARIYPSISSDLITVTASSVASSDQAVEHLINGSGMQSFLHDNNNSAFTMWHTHGTSDLISPAPGLPQSPAWVKFDFAQPMRVDTILIWNHNQQLLTDRGFRRTHIYGTTDGSKWFALTADDTVELPRANAAPNELPTAIKNASGSSWLKSVIIAADVTEGNYGGACYGLSAVRFAVRPLDPVVPANQIHVSASTVASPDQAVEHLVDGTGMVGGLHDSNFAARSMWHTHGLTDISQPEPGLPASPAWVKFDFDQPQNIDAILIWNHNQENLTDRGFRKTHIYGTTDGVTWFPMTSGDSVELKRASGAPLTEAAMIGNAAAEKPIKAVIIAADVTDGNYGGNCYGLSAVRFVLHSD